VSQRVEALVADPCVSTKQMAPEQSRDAHEQLGDVTRFHQTIIDTEFEGFDLARQRVAGGEHQKRGAADAPDAPSDLTPIEVRKPEIEHHQLGIELAHRGEAAHRIRVDAPHIRHP
jgi:hypothetical protein